MGVFIVRYTEYGTLCIGRLSNERADREEEHHVSELGKNIEEVAQAAVQNDDVLAETVENLAGSSRKKRQIAASVISAVSREDASRLTPYTDQINDALNRPEAQTRWECLEALTNIVPLESRLCDKAIPGAESALFDEENGLVRLAAMRFLCALGATTENRSKKTWPLIDEGIQCYHGDPEFQEMLAAVVGFSAGKLDPQVKEELAARMSFDAANGKGALGKRAKLIMENLK